MNLSNLSFRRSVKRGADSFDGVNNSESAQIGDFNYYAKYCAKKIAHFIKTRDDRAVYPDIKPGYLRTLIQPFAPQYPESFSKIIDEFFQYILPATAHWNHSRFVAYFPAGNAFANVYGDMLSTAFGGVGFTWTAQPSLSELENVMMDWYARALGLPKEFMFDGSDGKGGGCTHNTASDAIFTTIVAARHIPLKAAGCYPHDEIDHTGGTNEDAPHPGVHLPKLVAYTSQEAHSCVEKGCRVALCTVRILKPDENNSLTGPILEAAIHVDKSQSLIPFYCCATLGTTGTCAFDDLKTIGPVCKQNNMYLHVDAAYAGNAFICKDMDWLKEGLEYADSIEINPYKLMLGAVDLSCLFLRNVKQYKTPFYIDATYLLDEFHDNTDEEIKKNEIDYRHYGIALSRRMRSLKLFFLFRMHGLNGLRQYINDIRHMATTFEGLVSADSRFEVVNQVKLGLVVLRQKPQGGDSDNDPEGNSTDLSVTDKKNMNLLLRINKSRDLHLVPCISHNRYVLRVSMNYEHLTTDHIDHMMKTFGRYYVSELDSDFLDHLRRSPNQNMSLREASRLTFAHFINGDFTEFEKRQQDPTTRTIPLTFGPVFVPSADATTSNRSKSPNKRPLSRSKAAKPVKPSYEYDETDESFIDYH